MNGDIKGNEEGEWTNIRERGQSVIDYIITDERAREKIERMEVESRVDSDHQLVTVWIKSQNTTREGSGKRKGNRVKRGIWSKEGKKFFGTDLVKELKIGKKWMRSRKS